ncbi:hypothetical protein MSG28_010686 [Choristoneura fumiferana]|uniref:Uncharacterized protein n=1 Tax=Choristoneura fumiferana TaxID=7141 RepID=A0ACC0KND3_CHOFU|nr:hypothetical protein MSG28_010686 [Choristoneura fumiferana]
MEEQFATRLSIALTLLSVGLLCQWTSSLKDNVNRTKVMGLLLDHALSNPARQFVFLTPQDASTATAGPNVKIHKTLIPRRGSLQDELERQANSERKALRALIMSATKRKYVPEKEELIENGAAVNNTGQSNIKGDEAEFSFVNWPFSVKLLWAPIVDALFWPKFGRRKTWLVPVQYLIGIVMIIMSSSITDWLGSDDKAPSMMLLTISFLFLNFLAATQDIAVDGWALTMLKRCNVGHASTCNTVGQTAGFFLGYVLFLALESPYFCNKYLRVVPEEEGLVTLASFLFFWGWIFIVSTTLIAFLKHEAQETTRKNDSQSRGISDIVDAYKQLYTIVKLPAVRTLALVLFTAKLGFCASDAVSGLKLVEAGVPREDLALLAVPLVPVQIILPVLLARHTTGPTPLSLWLHAFPFRLLVGPLAAALVALTPTLIGKSGPSYAYLLVLMALYIFHQTLNGYRQQKT